MRLKHRKRMLKNMKKMRKYRKIYETRQKNIGNRETLENINENRKTGAKGHLLINYQQ